MDHVNQTLSRLPTGIRSSLAHLFDNVNGDEARNRLNRLRRVLEQLVAHLCVGKGIVEEGFSRRVSKLASIDSIPRDVHAYMDAWWSVGSFGSHFQPQAHQTMDWGRHLAFCQLAASAVLDWFLATHPPIELTPILIEESCRCVGLMTDSAQDAIVWPVSPDLLNRFDDHDSIFLHGGPWLGKTTLGVGLALRAIRNGFVPIVFHERTVVTPMELYGISLRSPNNLSSLAGWLNEFVPAKLFTGTSFVVFLDDPFGHRRLITATPLNRLHINAWLELARNPECLGKIQIVITSPTSLTRSVQSSAASPKDPIGSRNLQLLEGNRAIELTIDCYSESQLAQVVRATAFRFGALWASRQDICNLVSNEMKEQHAHFAALRDFCVETRSLGDDALIEKTISHFRRRQNISGLVDCVRYENQGYLLLVIICEELLTAYREHAASPRHTYGQLSEYLKISIASNEVLTAPELDLMSWIGLEAVAGLGVSELPTFRHPEIAAGVRDWVRTKRPFAIGELLVKLAASDEEDEGFLSRWELTHLTCQLAEFIDTNAAATLARILFSGTGGRFDPPTIIEALILGWEKIAGNPIEPHALIAIKRLINEARPFTRPLIHAIVDNWREVSEEIRRIPAGLNSKQVGAAESRPEANSENVLTFIASVAANYNMIVDCARRDSGASQECLEYFEAFVTTLTKMHDKPVWPSRVGDGLFNDASLRPLGRRVLEELVAIGKKRGAWDEDSPIVSQIRDSLKSSK